jgi:hypothetical protein
MTRLGSCRCGVPAVRLLCITALCHDCAEAILEPIRDRVFIDESGIGWGRQAGPLRTDWGERWARLQCTVCQASWVGPIGEVCGFCIRTHELLIDAHRKALLRPDAEIMRTVAQRETWARRLADGVKAEILTVHEARSALARWEHRHAA